MSAKIIVAGGGHGGIGTAILLAEKGYDVTVYEKTVGKIWAMIGQIYSLLIL